MPERSHASTPRRRRTPTMEDVARAAGVSRALVSLVMRDQPHVSPERRQRVWDAATRLGYRPNAVARSLASRKSRSIGVILDDLSNLFFAETAAGIEELAWELGYPVLLGTGGLNPRRESSVLAALLEHRVDGVILVGSRLRTAELVAASRETAITLVGRTIRGGDVDSVVVDETRGTELALEHLTALGHRRIAHVDAGRAPGGPQRRAAYLRGMRRRGLGELARVVPGDFTEEAGARAARTLLAEGELPTAIFAANDMVAVGLLDGLGRAGVRVPDDVSLVGFDNTAIAHLAHVPLTSVDQPRVEMGRWALQLLVERIEGRRNAVTRFIPPRLVVRESTGSAPDALQVPHDGARRPTTARPGHGIGAKGAANGEKVASSRAYEGAARATGVTGTTNTPGVTGTTSTPGVTGTTGAPVPGARTAAPDPNARATGPGRRGAEPFSKNMPAAARS